jgi:hypothetical protein
MGIATSAGKKNGEYYPFGKAGKKRTTNAFGLKVAKQTALPGILHF